MARQQQIKKETYHYVTVITTPSLQKLPVNQLGNKLIHRLFRKTKLQNCSMECTTAKYSCIYEFIPRSLNAYFRCILIIYCYLRQVFQAYIQKHHRSSKGPLNSPTLRRIFKWKCLSKQSRPISKRSFFFKIDWLRKFVFQARAACEQKWLSSNFGMIMAGENWITLV